MAQYGYGVPQGSGGDYGLAYGIGAVGAGIPDAMLRGESIKRQRAQEDFERAREKNAYDRQMTQQQINDFAPEGAPPQVEQQNIVGYNMTGDDSGKVYSPKDVAVARGQLTPYADAEGNINVEGEEGPPDPSQAYGGLNTGKNLKTLFSPKTETKKRDMNPYEKAAWTATQKATFAMQRGRGDLAMSYMGEATKAHLTDRFMKVQRAVEYLGNGSLEQAKNLYNEIGDAGQIDNITLNDDGSFDFHTHEGIRTITREQLQDSVQHAQQLTWDPKLQSQYVMTARKGGDALQRAKVREGGVEYVADSRSNDVAAKIAGTSGDVVKKIEGAKAVAQIRGANKGSGGGGKVTQLKDEVNTIALAKGHKDAKGNPVPTAEDWAAAKRSGRLSPEEKAEAQALGALKMMDEMKTRREGKPAGAPAQPSSQPATKVNPANNKTYYLHPDGKYYLAPAQ